MLLSTVQGYCGRAPTIELDIAVDMFFVLEIFVHFYTGQVSADEHAMLCPALNPHSVRHQVVRGSIQMNFKSVARIYLVGMSKHTHSEHHVPTW